MGFKSGHKCKVTLGSNTVVGMGVWNLEGITADEMESSSFDQNWKSFEYGMKDGGTISFNGFFDPEDSTGQMYLQKANLDNTNLTSLRLYINNTSYYVPCATSGYFKPGDSTTGSSSEDTVLSHMNITSFSIGAEKAGLCTIDFTAKVSGVMVLV